MKDHIREATHYAYNAHDKLMRLWRLNLNDTEKKVAIGAVMADLRNSMKELENELQTIK